MNLTAVIFLGVFSGGLLATLFLSPKYGILTYLLIFHMSPNHSWWARSVPDLRYLLVIGAVAVIVTLLRTNANKAESWTGQPAVKWLLFFVMWLWLLNLWAISPFHLDACFLYSKHLAITFVIYRIAKDNPAVLSEILLVVVLGCGWFGWQTLGRTGRVEGAAGAIADANTLGMHCAVGLMFAAMLILGGSPRHRLIAFFCTPLILNTIILSSSRGAFLAVVAGGLAAFYFCPPSLKPRFVMLGALGLVLFFTLAHRQFIERITELYVALTSEEQVVDNSASSRVALVKAGWRMALDYPQGVGHRGTAVLSPNYIEARYLTHGSKVESEAARGAHNTIMGVIVEYGFGGLAIFLFMLASAARAARRLRAYARAERNHEVAVLNGAIGAGLVVVFVAGLFGNFSYAEVQYWLFGMLTALWVIVTRRFICAAR